MSNNRSVTVCTGTVISVLLGVSGIERLSFLYRMWYCLILSKLSQFDLISKKKFNKRSQKLPFRTNLCCSLVYPRVSDSVAFSLIPILKNTGVTLNDVVSFVGSIACTDSGTGRSTLIDCLEPITRGIGSAFVSLRMHF